MLPSARPAAMPTLLAACLWMLLAAPVSAAPLAEWDLSYNEGGGGIELASPDGDFRFRQLGYIQVRGDVHHSDFKSASQAEVGLRRARLDWIVDVQQAYQLLVEIDGADFNAANQSDFDLVVAKISGPLFEEGRWTVGKFITPFSTENNVSSRSLDMIERHLALNSLFLLPALDVQFGLEGRYPLSEDWSATLGVFNGNGRAADNLSDDNDHKEVQLRLDHRCSKHLSWSISGDVTSEEPQMLQLRGYTFVPYSSVSVEGTRYLYGASFRYEANGFALEGEGLYADFDDAGAKLAGGYLQPSVFSHGDRTGGLEYLLRLDAASIDKDGVALAGDTIRAITVGANWYVNGNVRFKVNLIGEDYDGPGNSVTPASGVQGEGFKPYLLSELQFKF